MSILSERTGLRERALEVYRAERAERAEQARREAELDRDARRVALARKLEQQLGIEVHECNLTGEANGVFRVDDLAFGLEGHAWDLCLYGPCRDCGELAPQAAITDGLRDVARYLEEPPEPCRCDDCSLSEVLRLRELEADRRTVVADDYASRVADAGRAAISEAVRAADRFPTFNSGHEGYAVILEELDELWDEVKHDEHQRACREAVQVAAMALRFVADLTLAGWEGGEE